MARHSLRILICAIACLLLSWQAHSDTISNYKNQLAPGPAADAVRAGVEAVQKGDFAHAEADFQKALQLKPDEPHVLALLADLSVREGRLAAAQSYLQTDVNKNPKSAVAEEAMGRYWALQKNDASAESALQKAIQLDPKWVDARISLGDFYLSRGKSEEALITYREALAADLNNPLTHYDVAKALEATGDDHTAEAELRTSVRLAPLSALPHLALGDLLSRKGGGEAAIAEYQTAAKLDPKSGMPYVLIAQIQQREGHPDLAEQSYRKAILIDPNQLVALNDLAWIDIQKPQKLDEALSFSRKTVQLRPNEGQYLDTLGWVYHARGDNQQAITTLKKGVAAAPEDPEIHYHLAVVYQESRMLPEALAEINKSLALKKDFPEAADAHKRDEDLATRVHR